QQQQGQHTQRREVPLDARNIKAAYQENVDCNCQCCTYDDAAGGDNQVFNQKIAQYIKTGGVKCTTFTNLLATLVDVEHSKTHNAHRGNKYQRACDRIKHTSHHDINAVTLGPYV